MPSLAGVDYIFEETKAEDTWIHLIDTGVDWVGVKAFSNTDVFRSGIPKRL